ncbi:MAG: DUF4037 domain-containing protein [Mycobacteriales bacterium]
MTLTGPDSCPTSRTHISPLSPGQRLSQRFYEHAVLPRVAPVLGGAPHAAALLGDGSEVLGFDDTVSPDHDFGPRVTLFVSGDTDRAPIFSALESLPERFDGLPTAYRDTTNGDRDFGSGTSAHHVEVTTASEFFTRQLGYDPVDGMTLHRWLTTPTQLLATLTTGVVFADHGGELTRRRAALRWYPDDVWRYVLAAGWLRVSQEVPFVGRAGAAGDELGSTVVAGRVARDLMRLAFLIERRWAPYSKWLGRAFGELPIAAQLVQPLRRALHTTSWRDREAELCQIAGALIVATNRLELAPCVDPAPHRFYERDITVVRAQELATALVGAVDDSGVRAVINTGGTRTDGMLRLPGAIDQVVDSVEVLTCPERRAAAAALLGL